MAEYRHLAKAPITEAIIDFRVKLPQGFEITNLACLKDELKKDYPEASERKFLHFEIKDVKKAREGLNGYILKSEDKANVAQFRLDGFTFSRLKPYTKWEDVFKEAKRLWSIYMTKATPKLVTRIAVRYINNFTIPEPVREFSEYLNAPPVVPEGLSQTISNFLTRVTMINAENKITANLTQALEPRSDPNSPTFIIDIDVFKCKEFKVTDEEIWSHFEQFRDLKNQIFFKSITEKTAKLFE